MDFSNLKVLVVGDICLDIVEKGESTRLSPEAPVPVILNPIKEYSLGMAGNVAVSLKNLGADVYISTYYGETGKPNTLKVFSLLKEEGIKYKSKVINSYSHGGTIVKKRIFSNNQQVARIDHEISTYADNLFLKEMEKVYNVYNTNEFDLIIISDYNKGFITKDSWSFMKPVLENYNKGKFFVDTKKLDVLNYYEGMYIFPNTKEMNALLEYNNCKTRNELREEMDLDFIVETASEEGAYLYKDDGKLYHCPAFSTHFNTIYGAGDIFVAAFALYYTKFNSKLKALEFANYCCSKAVMKRDRCSVELNEVIDFIKGAYK